MKAFGEFLLAIDDGACLRVSIVCDHGIQRLTSLAIDRKIAGGDIIHGPVKRASAPT